MPRFYSPGLIPTFQVPGLHLKYSDMMEVGCVKNRFSDLTKVQIYLDQYRIDIMNDCLGKALREGCCKREQAWMGVSSTEKTNTG